MSIQDYIAQVDHYIESGRTDGWPIMLPTPEGVAEMLAYVARAADESIGRFAFRAQPVTVRDVAEVALMAGCLPSYMPLVLAAFELLLEPALDSERLVASSDGLSVMLIVNGPIRTRINVNSGRNVLGPGFRANASIGRALRLGLINFAGAFPGPRHRATLGSAYQYTCVVAEDEESIPWKPLQTDFGFDSQDSTVLLLWTQQPRQIVHLVSREPAQLLRAIGDELCTVTHFSPPDAPVGPSGSQFSQKAIFLIPRDFQEFVREAKWTKRRMQEVLHESIGRRAGAGRAAGYGEERMPTLTADDTWIPFYTGPEEILIVGAGAGGGCGQSTAAPVLRWGIRRVAEASPAAKPVSAAPISWAAPSQSSAAAALSLVNRYLDRGFTDGLPVLPPTPEGVAMFAEAARRSADDIVGTFNWRTTPITVKDVAINALMAGCLPQYMPVVLMAFEMLLEPELATSGWGASAGGWAPWMLLNGPVRDQLHVNCGAGAFGPGARANASIGRAIRLSLMNVCGIKPDVVDRSVQGQAYKYTCVFGEDEENSPWAPLHVELGFQEQDSTVTVLAGCTDPRETSHRATDPEAILAAIAEDLSTVRNYNVTNIHPGQPPPPYSFGGTHSIVVLGGAHREALRAAGWTRRQVQEYLWTHVRRSVGDLKRTGFDFPGRFRPDQTDTDLIPLRRTTEDFYVVCAGGPGGHSLSTRTGQIRTRKLP